MTHDRRVRVTVRCLGFVHAWLDVKIGRPARLGARSGDNTTADASTNAAFRPASGTQMAREWVGRSWRTGVATRRFDLRECGVETTGLEPVTPALQRLHTRYRLAEQ
jgi:hypothetical protein